MLRRFPLFLPAAALAAAVTLAFASARFRNGPLPSETGAPAIGGTPEEPDCTLCHSNFSWNNLNTPGGAVEILDLPETYLPGQTYALRVRLGSDSTVAYPGRRWGFQLTAVRASDGEGAGSFVLPDPDTLQILPGDPSEPWPTRSYVEHTRRGTRDGLASPVEWSFTWEAPAMPQGSVIFFCAGNAADGTGDPGGDFVFTAADTVKIDPTPVVQISWGRLKARYR